MVNLPPQIKVGAWLVATIVAAIALGTAAVKSAGPSAEPTLTVFLIGGALLEIALNAYGMASSLRKTPITRGTDWLAGLQASMIAYSRRAAWAAKHPWLWTAIQLIGWVAVSAFSAARWAAYSH